MQVLEAINSTAPERYQFREFPLDRHERQLTADGKAVHLQPRCFDVLLCLLQQPGKLVEKQAIIRGSTEL
jgi:DNA-binding winged helix-turn-helix (wHTH) protein